MSERRSGESFTRGSSAGSGAEVIAGKVRPRVPIDIKEARRRSALIFNGYSVLYSEKDRNRSDSNVQK